MLFLLARSMACSAASAFPIGSSGKCAAMCSRLLAGSRGIMTTSMSAIGSHMSDNDPKALEHHKEKALKGEVPSFVPNAEGWHETLASVSEAVVKAERNVDDDSVSNAGKLEQLQKHTIEVVQQLHHVGEEGASQTLKHSEMDVAGSPAHSANLEHTRKAPGSDPR